MTRRQKVLAVVGIVLVGVLLAVGIGAFVWLSDAAEPMPEALAALTSDADVTVTTEPWLIFEPTGKDAKSGFLFYPGGKVDPRAYAPAARAIAQAGHLAVIVPMPFNLAVLAPNRADAVIAAFPEIDSWAIGGHSLGGTMAARYAEKRPDEISALALWASYPMDDSKLAERTDLAVGSVYGTLDGLVSQEDIDNSRALLPEATAWTAIDGGNHAQFGWYGPQDGDNAATITREQQQALAVEATLALLNSAP